MFLLVEASETAGGRPERLSGPDYRYVRQYTPGQQEKSQHVQLYTLLKKVTTVFRRHGIPFWAMCGTTLGAIRHGGIVPWDDDVDLGIWAADVPRARAAIQADLKGAAVWGSSIRTEHVSVPGTPQLTVDIFPMQMVDGAIRFANPRARKDWGKMHLTPGEFTPFRSIPFGSGSLPVVGDPCSFLDRVYPQWDQLGRITRHVPLVSGNSGDDKKTLVQFVVEKSRRLCKAVLPLGGL